MTDKKKTTTEIAPAAGEMKRTRSPHRRWPVRLATKVPGFETDCFEVIPGENNFSCDGDALAMAAGIPDFVKENDVRVIRVSNRIVLKQPKKPVQIHMQFE